MCKLAGRIPGRTVIESGCDAVAVVGNHGFAIIRYGLRLPRSRVRGSRLMRLTEGESTDQDIRKFFGDPVAVRTTQGERISFIHLVLRVHIPWQ